MLFFENLHVTSSPRNIENKRLCGFSVSHYLVVDPHSDSARHVESLEYQYLGAVGELDKHNNLSRTRARPQMPEQPARKTSLVEIVYNQVKEDLDITEEIPS